MTAEVGVVVRMYALLLDGGRVTVLWLEVVRSILMGDVLRSCNPRVHGMLESTMYEDQLGQSPNGVLT
jgi:hypothetical protein